MELGKCLNDILPVNIKVTINKVRNFIAHSNKSLQWEEMSFITAKSNPCPKKV